ncbi:HAD family hydrolase [Curtobacterium flaccumfaciens]|nr:HAD family hydrolase [Curtobacterium flaccumfaciens]
MEHHTVPTTVLWDIDGTLVMNASSPGNLYHLALERAVGRDLVLRVGHQHGRTDAGLIAEHVRAHDLDSGLIPVVSGHLRDLTEERHRSGDHRSPAPGAIALVARFAELGWRNGLLTGNSAYRARVKLQGAGFDTEVFDWGHSFFGDEEVDRSAVAARAAEALSGERAVIVGTPRGTARRRRPRGSRSSRSPPASTTWRRCVGRTPWWSRVTACRTSSWSRTPSRR